MICRVIALETTVMALPREWTKARKPSGTVGRYLPSDEFDKNQRMRTELLDETRERECRTNVVFH